MLAIKAMSGVNYRISLPASYILEEKRGPDFSVYYFISNAINDKHIMTGGSYLGNFLQKPTLADQGCNVITVKLTILGDVQEWESGTRKGYYKVQIITDNKYNSNGMLS